MALIFAPVAEELTFRLILVPSPFRLSFGLIFLGGLAAEIFFELFLTKDLSLLNFLLKFGSLYEMLIIVAGVFLLGIIIGFVIKKSIKFRRVENFYSGNFRLIFYVSAVLFGLVHSMNFYNVSGYWVLLPLLILPQVIFGFVLGYVRVVYGLGWSMFAHFFHNAITSLPLVLLTLIPLSKLAKPEEEGKITESLISGTDAMVFLMGTLVLMLFFIFFIISWFGFLFELGKKKK